MVPMKNLRDNLKNEFSSTIFTKQKFLLNKNLRMDPARDLGFLHFLVIKNVGDDEKKVLSV